MKPQTWWPLNNRNLTWINSTKLPQKTRSVGKLFTISNSFDCKTMNSLIFMKILKEISSSEDKIKYSLYRISLFYHDDLTLSYRDWRTWMTSWRHKSWSFSSRFRPAIKVSTRAARPPTSVGRVSPSGRGPSCLTMLRLSEEFAPPCPQVKCLLNWPSSTCIYMD